MKYDYLIQEVISELENIAHSNDITIFDIRDLEETTPDTVMTKANAIFMNDNFNKNSYPFRLAHELSHLLYGENVGNAVYHFSTLSKRNEEMVAHKHAIKMLMSIKTPSNPLSFMDAYKIPSWLKSEVENMYIELNS